MARTSRGDWLDEGLRILREGGEAALTIDELCRGLDRTKGAYYHHFEAVTDYLDALLEHWELKHTEAPIRDAEAGKTPAERRKLLDKSVRRLDMRLELAVRAWALRDTRAHRVLARVDKKRVDYLTQIYAAQTGDESKARQLGQLEYAAFVGAQQLFTDLSTREARELEAALHRAMQLLAQDR